MQLSRERSRTDSTMPDVPVAGVSPISSPPHEVETESIPQPEMEPREEGELESDDETEAEEEPRPGQGQSDRRAWTSSYRSDYFRKGKARHKMEEHTIMCIWFLWGQQFD